MPPPIFPIAEGLGARRVALMVAACVVAIVAGFTLAEQPYLVFAGLFGLMYVTTLAVNAKTIAWLVVALQPAALIVPFFPGRPFFWELCAILSWPSLLAYFLVNREKLGALRLDRLEKKVLFALLGYLSVLIFLMMYRGVGFRAFGGEQMGGRFYAQQVILTILPLLLAATELSERQQISALSVGWVLSLTYLVADFAFSSGGSMSRILYFFELPPDATNFEVGFEMTGVRRYQSLWCVGSAILSALLVWLPVRDVTGRRAWLALPIGAGALLLALSSGHRTVFVQTLATVILLASFQRFWTPLRTIGTFLLVVGGMATIYLAAPTFPLALQRAISFLPGIEVSQLAHDNAWDTLRDRVEVLKLAANDVPRYWLAGRGFGMERLDLLPTDDVYSGIWLQYINGCIYNGVLGSILKTGLIGFLCSAVFIFYISKIALNVVRLGRALDPNSENTYTRLCFFVSAQWFSFVIFFYFMHGDSAVWMKVFGLPAALVVLCQRTLAKRGEQLPPVQGIAE